ncbi:MAG: flagellar assembly protein FliX [Candidatus Eiseniibacteriota bacterium]
MKIDPSARVRTTPLRRAGAGRGAAPAGEFASHLAPEPAPAAVSTPAPVATNPLLSIQEMADATTGRSRAKARGEAMLDRLDEIRLGLLAGAVPKERLVELSRLARVRRGETDDPRLVEVLDEIQLRAEVELAKLDFKS